MNALEFTFSEMPEFARLIAALNASGVPYSLRRDNVAIQVTIGKGF